MDDDITNSSILMNDIFELKEFKKLSATLHNNRPMPLSYWNATKSIYAKMIGLDDLSIQIFKLCDIAPAHDFSTAVIHNSIKLNDPLLVKFYCENGAVLKSILHNFALSIVPVNLIIVQILLEYQCHVDSSIFNILAKSGKDPQDLIELYRMYTEFISLKSLFEPIEFIRSVIRYGNKELFIEIYDKEGLSETLDEVTKLALLQQLSYCYTDTKAVISFIESVTIMVKYLLNDGVKPNADIISCFAYNLEILQFVLSNYDIDLQDEYIMDVLSSEDIKHEIEVLELLIKNGAIFSMDALKSYIRKAIEKENNEIIKLLLKHEILNESYEFDFDGVKISMRFIS